MLRCMLTGNRTSLLNKKIEPLEGRRRTRNDVHFHPFDFHSPRVGAFVEMGLHRVRDVLAVGENLLEGFGASAHDRVSFAVTRATGSLTGCCEGWSRRAAASSNASSPRW